MDPFARDLTSEGAPEHGEDDGGFSSHLANFTVEQAADFFSQLNSSFAEIACGYMEKVYPTYEGGCHTAFDGLICWPAAQADSVAVLSCLAEIHGIKYNTSQNVSRWCHSNGTWDYTNYNACKEVPSPVLEPDVVITSSIYVVGYISSLVPLIIALWIFVYFKDLRCLRNVIHANLICTYILTDFVWIFNLILQMYVDINLETCVFLTILLHYFHLTNFFWMFVEGLYLYMLVVKTFSGEHIKLRVYATIGWGCPAVFTVLWAIVKASTPETKLHENQIRHQCPWMEDHIYDWIYQAPAIGILLINSIFLFVIMWVLITKLRSAQTVETQQYRKAAKALLVLVPLLGITYVLVIAGPTHGVYKNIHEFTRAILISTQGFMVALFYCFLNTEVQNTIQHHTERWKTARSFRGSRRYTYSGHSKDWSPRSRTESIRLYSQPSNYRKRESSVSEITTTTLVNVNGGSRLSNGSQTRSPFLHPSGSENV